MRTLAWLLVAVVLVGGFVMHRRQQQTAAVPQPSTAVAAPVAREPSEHNWPKRALDRVDEVKRQVAAERKSNDVP